MTTVVGMRNCCAVKRVIAPAPSPSCTAWPPRLSASLGNHSSRTELNGYTLWFPSRSVVDCLPVQANRIKC